MASSVEEKYALITSRLAEVLGEDIIRKSLAESEETGKPMRLYWGTATTGRPHIGYFVPMSKIADFLAAGVHVVILFADVHAFLDNLKAPIELIAHRVKYYSRIIQAVLKSIGVPTDRLEFVTGSSYQYEPKYNLDKYKLCAITSEHDARKAGAEVVKQSQSPPLSGLLYPLLQALDEEYLNVDVQFGGVDQRKIFTFAEANLPKLGYKKRAHLMNAMVPGLDGAKMSASVATSKIDFLDSPNIVKKKISQAYASPGEVEGNGLLAFLKAVILPLAALKTQSPFLASGAPPGTQFSIDRAEKHGGPLHYASYDAIEKAYASQELHPADLKQGVTDAINLLLKPIQEEFANDSSFQEIERLAYPPAEAAPKKVKEKKINPRFAPTAEGEASQQTTQQSKTVPDPPTLNVAALSMDEGVKELEQK